MIKKLETNRLVIRSTKKEDADFCIDMWSDDEMGKYMSNPPREKAGNFFLEWKKDVELYEGCYYFVAVSKETGNHIGSCSAVPSEDKKSWDLGYCIHINYWRQSYATEMVTELIDFCYKSGGRKITAAVAQQNLGSNALLRKLGFYIEKKGFFKKQGTDILYDEYTYRIDLE